MCRLLGWVASPGLTLCDALGAENFSSFTQLSRIHADGWGVAYATPDGELALRRSTTAASTDPDFGELAREVVTSAAVTHLRWATPGLPVEPRNTHPFRHGDSAFAHNGGIYPLERLAKMLSPSWRARLGGTTDSEHYYLALLAEMQDTGADAVTAIRRVTARLAESYAPSSLNAMLLTPAALYVISCYDPSMRPVLPAPAPGDDLLAAHSSDEAYFELRYRRTNGAVVVASSGFPQPMSQGWISLANNHVLVIDRATLTVNEHALDTALRPTAGAAGPR